MNYYVRTTGDRVLDSSYSQIPYTLITDKEYKPIDSFINALYQINNEDSILLEDDLILCKNFKEEIEKVIEQYPNRIINFFWFPQFYTQTKESKGIVFNQCTYYPKGIAKQIADIMINVPRRTDYKKNMYSLIEFQALKQLGIKVLQYRPCLVQHLDTDTLLFDKTFGQRRTPYFLDYLNQLGITYEEAREPLNQRKLTQIMREDFTNREKLQSN